MHDVCESGIASFQAFARHTLLLRHPSFIDYFTTRQMLLESHVRCDLIVIVCIQSLYASFPIQTSFHPVVRPQTIRGSARSMQSLHWRCLFWMSPALNYLSLAAANWLPGVWERLKWPLITCNQQPIMLCPVMLDIQTRQHGDSKNTDG